MLIDCDSCEIRGLACRDCVVTFVTLEVRREEPVQADVLRLDSDQHAAIDALAAGGLVPPLRHQRHHHGSGAHGAVTEAS